MKIINLKDDIKDYCYDLDQSNVLILVTEYEIGCYDGYGHALSLNKDGSVNEYNLMHCSCYGPFENKPVGTWISLGAFIEDDRVLSTNLKKSDEIVKRFIEEAK